METPTKQILNELREIRIEITFIKEHMVDADTVLTPEEESRLDESLQEFRLGESTSLEDFEKEMIKDV